MHAGQGRARAILNKHLFLETLYAPYTPRIYDCLFAGRLIHTTPISSFSWTRGGCTIAGTTRRFCERTVTKWIYAAVHGCPGEPRLRGQVPPRQGCEPNVGYRGL